MRVEWTFERFLDIGLSPHVNPVQFMFLIWGEGISRELYGNDLFILMVLQNKDV